MLGVTLYPLAIFKSSEKISADFFAEAMCYFCRGNFSKQVKCAQLEGAPLAG